MGRVRCGPPDIEVDLDAKSAAEGRDPQLERAVHEVLLLLDKEAQTAVTPPAFPKPAKRPGG